ncbi:MAG: PilZ domain-containing protein [Bacillota bacterium]
MTIEKTKSFLAVNRKLEVRPDGDEGCFYKSLVLNVKENFVLISPPYRGRHDLLLHAGDQLDVVLLSDKEKYLFKGFVRKREKAPLKGYVIEVSDEAKRIQLRAFVRIKVAIVMEWAKLPNVPLDKKAMDNLHFFEGLMVDLSGGGASLIVNELLSVGSRILVRFSLDNEDKAVIFTLPAEIRRSYSLDERNKFAAGVSFFAISEKERDLIVEYIFYRQRKERFLEGEQKQG